VIKLLRVGMLCLLIIPVSFQVAPKLTTGKLGLPLASEPKFAKPEGVVETPLFIPGVRV